MNALNEMGICVSSGSACSASSREASHVLLAMGYPKEAARQSLRITIGCQNTEEEIDVTLAAIGKAIAQVRAMKLQL